MPSRALCAALGVGSIHGEGSLVGALLLARPVTCHRAPSCRPPQCAPPARPASALSTRRCPSARRRVRLRSPEGPGLDSRLPRLVTAVRAGGSAPGGGGGGEVERDGGKGARSDVGNGAVAATGGVYLAGAARFWRDARLAYTADPLGLEIAAIALPALLALAADPLASLVDTYFVGRIGPVELAGVGVSISVFNLVSKVLNIPLLNITTSFVAQDQPALTANHNPTQHHKHHQHTHVLSAPPSSSPPSSSSSPLSPPTPTPKPLVPSVSAALLIATALGILEALLLSAAAAPILAIMGLAAGSDMQEPALEYLRVRALGAPAVVVFLTAQGVFRGLKDTRTPLAASVSGNLVNVLLDPLLMFSCALGVSGAAAATVAAQYVMAGGLLLRLNSRVHLIPPSLSQLKFGRFFTSGGLLFGCTVALVACMTLRHEHNSRAGRSRAPPSPL